MHVFIVFFDYIVRCENITEIYNDHGKNKIDNRYAKFKCDKLTIVDFYDTKKNVDCKKNVELEIYSSSLKKRVHIYLSKNNILDLKELENVTNRKFYIFKFFNSAVFSQNKYINQKIVYFSHNGLIKGIKYIHNKEYTTFFCNPIYNLHFFKNRNYEIDINNDKMIFYVSVRENTICYTYSDYENYIKYIFTIKDDNNVIMTTIFNNYYRKSLFFSNNLKIDNLYLYSHKKFHILNEKLKKFTIICKKNKEEEKIKILTMQYKNEQKFDDDSYIIHKLPKYYSELFKYYHIVNNIHKKKIKKIITKINELYIHLYYNT